MAVYAERRSGRLSGKWIAEVTHLGVRVRKRFDTKHEADRWEEIVKVTGQPPSDPKALVVAHSLGDVAKEALEHHPGWEQGRDYSREQRLTHAIDVIGRDKPIADVEESDLDRLVT